MLSGVPIPTKNGEVIAAIVVTTLLTHGLVTEVSIEPPPPQAVAKSDRSNIVCFIDVIIHQDSTSYTGYYSYYFYYNITGTPARSRTERIFPFERNDFANLSTGANKWCERRDSNPQSLRREILSLLCIPFHHSRILVGPTGLEPVTNGL